MAIPQNMVLTTQLHNYRNLRNHTEKGDVQKTPSEVRIPWITKPCHSTPEKVMMTTYYLALNNARLATFKSIEYVHGLRNQTLPNTIV